MKINKVLPVPDDQELKQVMFKMTPERKKRMAEAASHIIDLVIKETQNPIEAIATIQIALDAMNERYFDRDYHGTVLMGNTRKIPDSPCWQCGKPVNRATAAADNGNAPEEGDTSICTHCGAISEFDEELRAVKPSDEKLKEVMDRPDVFAIVTAIKARKKEKEDGASRNG
jgi:hypothetical protein